MRLTMKMMQANAIIQLALPYILLEAPPEPFEALKQTLEANASTIQKGLAPAGPALRVIPSQAAM